VSSLVRRLSRALPLLVVFAFLSPPVPAAAWAAPPSLNGESVSGVATLNTSGCGLLGSGTFGFSISGSTATGPYPGPFTESGSVTTSGVSVTGFNASFTMAPTTGPQSGDTVAGTKVLTSAVFGLCAEGIAVSVNSTYRAIITLPSGERFCDTGTAVTNIGQGAPGTFSESFSSSATTATPIGTSGTCP
jgi:hypothetical protein